jgi:hypothetical protein
MRSRHGCRGRIEIADHNGRLIATAHSFVSDGPQGIDQPALRSSEPARTIAAFVAKRASGVRCAVTTAGN